MHYFKYLLLFICFVCSFLQMAHAEDWLQVDNNGKKIFLDRDSINFHNDSIYYNVRYYEEKVKDDLVVTIQSAGSMAGVVSTCKFSDYKRKKSIANTNTNKEASSMKYLNSSSLLYNADLIAISLSDIRTESIDFRPYMKELQRRVKMNWDPPKGNESQHVVLLFKIAKDGRLLSCKVLESSGLQSVDEAAIRAVHLAAPFRPLPSEYKGKNIDIQFAFDYNVYNEVQDN